MILVGICKRHVRPGDADYAVAMTAPTAWFDDVHPWERPGQTLPTPRCCEAVACVEVAIRAIPRAVLFTDEDVMALARATIAGMLAAGYGEAAPLHVQRVPARRAGFPLPKIR